ncbi:hypothetical protein GBA52_016457 [Prunus armeniaca]|nr:hypothetical protein GBA52_016457 [Prunus armeniaca]
MSLLEAGQNSVIATQIRELVQLDLIVKFDWDFDHYLEEDLPVALSCLRVRLIDMYGKPMKKKHC